MEAKAIHLAGLEQVPVNSFKGYYGHTLGAAGILESILTLQSMKEKILLPTIGFLRARHRDTRECYQRTETRAITYMSENSVGVWGM